MAATVHLSAQHDLTASSTTDIHIGKKGVGEEDATGTTATDLPSSVKRSLRRRNKRKKQAERKAGLLPQASAPEPAPSVSIPTPVASVPKSSNPEEENDEEVEIEYVSAPLPDLGDDPNVAVYGDILDKFSLKRTVADPDAIAVAEGVLGAAGVCPTLGIGLVLRED